MITDFGLSKELLPETNGRAHSFCGTIEYMAPEVVKSNPNGHDIAVDWWSVGVLTYELLTGASPFTIEGERNTQSDISRRILKTDPPMRGMGPEVKDFIERLLVKDPKRRLGGNKADANDLKSHPFFRKLNWSLLEQRKIRPPFVPTIKNELDTSNFSDEFTKQPASDSPVEPPPNHERLFKGYSFVAPSILLTKNVISDMILGPDTGSQRPNIANVCRFRMKNSHFWAKYELIDTKPIGDGTYSICIKCRNRFTGELVAVKVVKASHDVTKEVDMLKKCQGHPNIVRFIEMLQDEAYTFIVLELLEGGELFARIRRCSRFTEQEARQYFQQIVSAVAFMHEHKIAHRDIKPENMLFVKKDSNQLKIVDFGFATECNGIGMNTPCFTLGYAAPEMLVGTSYTEACDLWSLGVILYTMLCGQTPFLPKEENRERHDKYINDMASRIQRGSFDTDTEYWSLVSAPAKCLVTSLLTVDPKYRLDMRQVLAHQWFTGSSAVSPQSTPSLHTPRNQDVFVNEVKDTFDAFSHAQKLGFRLQDVSNAKLAQRRRHKKSISGSRSSDESERGISKSSSGFVASDQNCRSISTSASDIEFVSSTTGIVQASPKKSISSGLMVSVSDDGSRLSTSLEVPPQPPSPLQEQAKTPSISNETKTTPSGSSSSTITIQDEFFGFAVHEMAFTEHDSNFMEWLKTKKGRSGAMTSNLSSTLASKRKFVPVQREGGPMTRSRMQRRQGVDDRFVLLEDAPPANKRRKR